MMKIKGHTKITLTDRDGNKEIHEDNNMVTNAVSDYLENCGFLNFPNCDQNDLVRQLLGGILCFDDGIDEDADVVKVPSGLHMVANASLEVNAHDANVTELGRVSTVADETGWQEDGSFLMTFNWDMAYGNGTIACVCLTGQRYGRCGEGNGTSKQRTSSRVNLDMYGTQTEYTGIEGDVFKYDLEDSSCYALDRTDMATTHKGVLRKYRLPLSKVNLKGTRSAPVVISETEVELPEALYSASYIMTQSLGDNLLIWNVDRYSDHTWGEDFTQYLWTLEPDGTLTSETLLNTSGDALHGIQNAIFDGDYCLFVPTRFWIQDMVYRYASNTSTIYIMKRSTGVITKISNPYGGEWTGADDYGRDSGWYVFSSNGDGRIVTQGNYPFMVDAKGDTNGPFVEPINKDTYRIGNMRNATSAPLIRHRGACLYRDQSYIASINNLATPVVKDGTKTMVIQYRLTFEDTEENAIGEIGGGVS